MFFEEPDAWKSACPDLWGPGEPKSPGYPTRGGSRNASTVAARASDRNDPGFGEGPLRVGVLKRRSWSEYPIAGSVAYDATTWHTSSRNDESAYDRLDELATVM